MLFVIDKYLMSREEEKILHVPYFIRVIQSHISEISDDRKLFMAENYSWNSGMWLKSETLLTSNTFHSILKRNSYSLQSETSTYA